VKGKERGERNVHDKDRNGQQRTEAEEEDEERSTDVEEDRQDIEQDELEEIVERRASIQDTEDFSGLLLGVPGEGEVEKVVERWSKTTQVGKGVSRYRESGKERERERKG
jgi:hypothetical protein